MAASSSLPVDMTTKVGGRVFRPALPVVDGAGPTRLEQGFQQTLDGFCRDNIPIESDEGIRSRERVLNEMGALCRDWIRSVGRQKGMPPDVVEGAGGALYTSGSYRLGVHEPGADIDCILVAPAMCSRQEFFGTSTITDDPNYRDPSSLAERLRAHPEVTNFVPVEGAAVPILTFDWEGINIDLLFARLNINSVPPTFDIDNDAVLDGADSATEKSLNGPRVTNLIASFVSGTKERYQAFLTVVRCVRKWAKARGLYSNKMGYWGGVNCNLAVALTVQIYPNACPASLLRRFFLVFKTWRWPQPVLLTKPHDAGYGLTVWSPSNAMRQVAPMITPAYPAMNSTLAVSRQTLQIMQEEFNRGHEIVDQLWKDYQKDPSQTSMNWGQLFEPSDFFITYPRYLSLCIVGPSQADAQAWAGFVESRLRKLVSDLLARSLPLKKIQLWPKKMDACVADKSALLTVAQRQNCITYFIGFQIDKYRMRGNELNVEIPLYSFREYELSRFQPLVQGMDILVKSFGVKELPKICFEGIYEGGKIEAMKKRRKLRDADPLRQERKRLARLEELKARMEEIKRKKEEKQDRKRVREEVELEDQVKEEEEHVAKESSAGDDGATGEEENEETDLLESALDTIQDTGEKKTREEAQADRQKLLSGELLVEGGAVDSDDEEAGYIGDGARLSLYKKASAGDTHKDKRSLPLTEEQEEVLKGIGYSIVSDDESKMLGVNMIPPWRGVAQKVDEQAPKKKMRTGKITFLRKFDVVELDARGCVIDKGDEDFIPSKEWIGRKAGFEFKMAARGVGYYRTGKPVVVPSNTAY